VIHSLHRALPLITVNVAGAAVPLKEGKLKEKEVDERVRTLTHLTTEAGEEYDSSTLSLIAKADEDTIEYELVEAAIVHVISEEAEGGPWALLDGWNGLDDTPSKGSSALEGHGAILVFLPGSIEILKLQRQLAASVELRNALGKCQAEVLPLHGALSPAQQQAVFRTHSKDRRKIILSTNIAETSITIDDVTVVIDTGKMKEVQLHETSGITRLTETWVSQAAANQRRGRAGRVRCGAPHTCAVQLPRVGRVHLCSSHSSRTSRASGGCYSSQYACC
jgi:ATP-dependent RNA helicase DHX57